MPHDLEIAYGLSAGELLDAVKRHFRARVALEGVVSETQLVKVVKKLKREGEISGFTEHDLDGYPDVSVIPTGHTDPVKIECKNVRNHDEAYREGGEIVAYKVEVQKTRASQGDPSSRFYRANHFEILAVCLGKKTGNWKDFVFVKTKDLPRHPTYSDCLAVMHKVPLPTLKILPLGPGN